MKNTKPKTKLKYMKESYTIKYILTKRLKDESKYREILIIK